MHYNRYGNISYIIAGLAQQIPYIVWTAAPGSSGYVHGSWIIECGATVIGASPGSGWHTLYQGNPNFAFFTASVSTDLFQRGSTLTQPRYGLIACYDDRNNQVSVWINPRQGTLDFNTVVQGRSTWQSINLPATFDTAQPHTLTAVKSGTLFTFFLDGNQVSTQTIALANGVAGVATEDALVTFRNFSFRTTD